MKQSVFAIIVNWNGIADTLNCLESLSNINNAYANLTVLVVDNGSTNDSVAQIHKKYPDVAVLETGENLGFTGGNNVGFDYALSHNADFIWMLNNDTMVQNEVLSFVKNFDDPKVGACGSKIYFAKGHEYHFDRYTDSERGSVLWYAGGIMDWNNIFASHRGVDEVDKGQYDESEVTPFITGCSFIVRADVVRKVGKLDDAYYLYLEDLDWSLRIQKAGYKTLYVPSSTLWHVNAGSSGKPGNPTHEYYFTRNRLLLGFRYASARTKFALVREAVRFFFGSSAIRRKAVTDALLGKFGKQYEPKKIS